MALVTVNSVLAAVVAALPINPTDRQNLAGMVAALEGQGEAAATNVVSDVETEAAPLLPAAGAIVEAGANAVITHTVGPFAGLLIPAADRLLEMAGGDAVTAVSHLLGALTNRTGATHTAVVTVSPVAASTPAPTSPQ